MAAGDRYKNGKPKDIVRHARVGGQTEDITMCGRKNPGYITNDMLEVTCLRCIRRRRMAVENILNKSIA